MLGDVNIDSKPSLSRTGCFGGSAVAPSKSAPAEEVEEEEEGAAPDGSLSADESETGGEL